MSGSYLELAAEASSLCQSIQAQVNKLEMIEAAIALEDKLVYGPSSKKAKLTRSAKLTTSTPIRSPTEVAAPPGPAALTACGEEVGYKDFGTVMDKDDVTMDTANVELML
jgi:hypothetical protein